MAFFIVEDTDQNIRIELDRNRVETIGRHPDNSIQIHAGTVSGRHAKIYHDGECFVIEDAGSRNGTTVNDSPIDSPMKLYNDDRLGFGDALASFYDDTRRRKEPFPAFSDSQKLVLEPPSSIIDSLNVEITNQATEIISGETGSSSRFGMLEAKPAAKLKAILEISTALAGSIDLESMLPKILDTLLQVFRLADRGAILLKDDATGKLIPRCIKHRRAGEDETVRISQTVLDIVMEERKGIRSADAAIDEMFSDSESIADMRIRSMICVPMLALDGEPIGVISLDSLNPLGQFTDEDLDVLFAIAGQAALSYETARLMASYAIKEKQDNEMQIAHRVQLDLLPSDLPKVDGYEFFASYDAAQEVGGDYYDVFSLHDGRICVSFGDVAGKGVPGALIMSRMHSCVQATMAHVDDVQKAMMAINDHMCSSSVEGRFVTYILSLIDPQTHEVSLSNAGHMSPMIRHADGRVESFNDDLAGPPIGVLEDYPYEVETRKLKLGDMILIVTDGVDEAMNSRGELYGQDRVIEVLKKEHANARELGDSLLADVRRHADGQAQNDDITILAFGRSL